MIDLCLRYGANGVPILSNNGIDSQAEALIADYDPSLLKTPRALDVDDFIENYIGLRLHYTYLSHKGFIWGRMVFHNTKIIVFDPVKNCANEEAVDGLVEEWKKLLAVTKTPVTISSLGISQEKFKASLETIVRNAQNDPAMKGNPVTLTADEIRQIYLNLNK